MPIDFPNSPSVNDIYVYSGKSWIYDGTTWNLRGVAAGAGSITSTELANDAVIANKIASNAITSDKILNGTIVNADVSSTAAIDSTKITGWENDQVIIPSQIFN